ncbi:hypothetical protein M8J75_015568 [Diaphorina citri]|nr:hypothetical protein M8J75_015568 [Diaphorina citri]
MTTHTDLFPDSRGEPDNVTTIPDQNFNQFLLFLKNTEVLRRKPWRFRKSYYLSKELHLKFTMTSEEHKPLKEKFDKVCSQGHQIQKTLKYHQNQLKTLFSSPSKDLKELESSIDKLAQLYSDVDTRINQDYPQLKFNFFPANMDVSYSVKYAGGTSPNDLTLCHNRKSKLKEIRSSLKRKIISKKLHKSSCVEEKDCVIAVDMKRMVVRGVVMGCVQGAVVTILDIDTGDYKMATLDNIYELDEEAVSLYALCVRCSLDGDLTDLKEYWTADLSNYFITALKFGELVIEPSHNVDESTIPPKFKVTMEIFVDDTKVLNVNQWICEQLLPLVKQEAENCLDLNKVIRGLDSKVLMPYLPLSSEASVDSSSNLSDMNVCSSQIISSPEYSAQSSSSDDSEEYSVDIQIDKFNTPTFLPCQSPVPTGAGGAAGVTGKKEIDVYFTNENMASPSSESLVAERSKSKCDCGTNCASIVSCCPPELLTANPKVPRITTVIPSLARIPHGEPFYYTMKNKSKSSLLPTPSTNNTLSANKSETEVRCPEYYNSFYERKPLLSTPPLISHHSHQNNGLTGGSLPLIQRSSWSPKVQPQGILVPIRNVTARPKWSNGRIANDLKHKSDNSLSSSSCNYSNLRRGPRSNVYSNSILPPYMEDSYAASGDAFVAGAYDEKLVPIAQTNGPNSRGEGISLKEQHFCVAEHLDKVQSVKLPGSVLLVEPGQERKALVSFIETPGKFYVNIIEENTAHMEQLEEELCAHYSQVNNLVSLVTIEEARYHLGEFVAAKWKSDGRWYRARVIDWNPCHLANLAPVSSVGWSEAAIEMFSQFCNKTPHEVFYLTFQPSNNNDTSSSWSVVIRNEGGECINDLLVSSGFAIHTKVNGHATNPTPVPPTPAPTPPADSKDKGDPRSLFYKQQIARNRTRNKELIEALMTDVRNNVKVMVLMRGLPGCGKSTKVKELIAATEKLNGARPVAFSADHYFETPSGYQYNVKKLGEAHNWAYKATEAALLAFQSPVFIDNTNTEEFEILNYYNLAYHNWYKFYVLEPETEWAFDVDQLARKTLHNVPREKLARMLNKYCWPDGQKWTRNEQSDSVESCAEQLRDSCST